MKTWQMIKELTENPKKKFTYTGGRTYVIMEDGMIVWKGEYQKGQAFAIGYINERDREWEEVKQPVTFMEAVKSQKMIKVEHKDFELDGDFRDLDDLLYKIGGCFSSGSLSMLITDGKWYIED